MFIKQDENNMSEHDIKACSHELVLKVMLYKLSI